MERFALAEPMDAIDIWERDYIPYRERVASLNRLLLEAARAGDADAARIYADAARELGLCARSVATALGLVGQAFQVSYSGGLFHARDYVLPGLTEAIRELGGELIEPIATPVWGAALLARKEAICRL